MKDWTLTKKTVNNFVRNIKIASSDMYQNDYNRMIYKILELAKKQIKHNETKTSQLGIVFSKKKMSSMKELDAKIAEKISTYMTEF